MAVAANSRPVIHGLPSPLRSPTLSDAGMILPSHDGAVVRSLSPNPYIERPPSPPVLLYQEDLTHVKLASAPQARRRASQTSKTPLLSAQSSRSTLRAMVDPDAAAATAAAARDQLLASSPTVHNGLTGHPADKWTPTKQRRSSTASSSVHSEDLDNWPGFDSHHDTFDDSGLGLDDSEKRDRFPSAKKSMDDLDRSPWLNGHNSGSSEEDDEYSSAALSRRAEIILANAKKRLNVMEGNLRGARESLVVSPTFSATRSASELSLHISAARERDRRLYAGIGPIPPRMHSYRSSPMLSSQAHSRGLSETSVNLPFSSPSYLKRTPSNKRSSSAIGHTSGPWSAETFGQGRFPIKESRSYEVMRDPRTTWGSPEPQQQPQKQQPQYPARTSSRSSRSPPALETLPEDENGVFPPRSSSAASGLRDQMNDLKGRISSLKQRAQEDSMRRRSMQSLRTPSPFTSAQEWYSGADGYHSREAPLTANAGLGIKTDSPTRRELFQEDQTDSKSMYTTKSQQEGERLLREHVAGEVPATLYETKEEVDTEYEEYDDGEEIYETDEGDFVSVNGDNYEAGADSIYEDAVYEMPTTERHEDRVDAFDYEHFFLHSAMGTYSLEGRRSSSAGSESSTATTRPVTAVQSHDELNNSAKRVSYHNRNASADSVSTVASFATAAENQSDDEDEQNERMDQFSSQLLAQHNPRPATSSSHLSLRSDSAINMRRGNGASPTQSTASRASSHPADLASGLQVSKIFSILTESSSPTREQPRFALSEEEKQLIYSLAAGFQQLCADLQHTSGEQYERKEWRRRLDEARRVLAGEEGEEDASF